MRRAIVIQRNGAAPERRDLASAASAGGSAADSVNLPGAPAAAALLHPCAAGLVVEARSSGLRAAGRLLSPGGRRLLRAGEALEVAGASVCVEPDVLPDGTRGAAAALIRDLARGGELPLGPHLLILSGPSAGRAIPLEREAIAGRGRAASVRLDDPLASRRHARFVLGAGGASVEDLGSKNGLRVNGVPADPGPRALSAGDEVTIGETVIAVVNVPAREAASGEPPSSRRPRPWAAAALLGLCAVALALAS